jgi:16S rRNA (guanine966-N2)-methyltransferase
MTRTIMSRIRIISGSLRSRRLAVPQGGLTRPTSDRVREAIFNMVQSRLPLQGVRVLDLYSGTGALGMEAISRGAAEAVFVDANPMVLACSRRNAEELGIVAQCSFIRGDARAYLESESGTLYHLILADPPYGTAGMDSIPDLAVRRLEPAGVLVLEHDRTLKPDGQAHLLLRRAYGRTVVSLFSPKRDEDSP